MEFIDVRIRFKKVNSARYISHLDLNRFMMRVLKRSGLPIWHTEGFNPHPYVTFALPLSLGHSSICEVMDFRITKYMPAKEIFMALNKCLSNDICVTAVYEPKHKAKDIMFAGYEIIIPDCSDLLNSFNEFSTSESILVEKVTKKNTTTIDLKPLISDLNISTEENNLKIELALPAGTSLNINPSLIVAAFGDFVGNEISPVFITRKKIFCNNMIEFK